MSRRALLLACRDQLWALPAAGGLVGTTLQGGIGILKEEIDLTLLGRPHPRMGQRFVGVHAGPARRTQQVSAGLDRTFEVLVTVSMKLSVPPDRVGGDFLEKQTLGFDDLCELVTKCLHADSRDGRVRAIADNYLDYAAGDDGSSARPFAEPLEYLGDAGPQEVGPDWFGGTRDGTLAGVKCVLRFGGARRVQTYVGPSYPTLLVPGDAT